MPVLKGARKALTRLREAGCAIHIITDRFWYHGIQRDTTNWLTRNDIPFNSVIFARKIEKQGVASRLNVNWFVEDRLSNALSLSTVCNVLLLDHPYNQGATPKEVTRVRSIEQAIKLIHQSLHSANGRRRRGKTPVPCVA
jgi:uncharacterized HAD superfamily protein